MGKWGYLQRGEGQLYCKRAKWIYKAAKVKENKILVESEAFNCELEATKHELEKTIYVFEKTKFYLAIVTEQVIKTI